MAFSNRLKSESFIASVDLNTSQFHIVDLANVAHKVTIGAAAGGFGVLQNKPLAGEHATVAVEGITKCSAGAAVAVGDYITSAASGYASVVTAASGSVFSLEIDRFVSAATLAI